MGRTAPGSWISWLLNSRMCIHLCNKGFMHNNLTVIFLSVHLLMDCSCSHSHILYWHSVTWLRVHFLFMLAQIYKHHGHLMCTFNHNWPQFLGHFLRYFYGYHLDLKLRSTGHAQHFVTCNRTLYWIELYQEVSVFVMFFISSGFSFHLSHICIYTPKGESLTSKVFRSRLLQAVPQPSYIFITC